MIFDDVEIIAMNIIVCIKQVPNTKEVRIDPKTKNIVREGVPSILNPYDENALEAALSLRDQTGGTVTAISMGPPQAAEILIAALEMGADRGILLSDPAVAGADTLATGYALAGMIKNLRADLVLCGAEAIDGCTGQVGPIIAENLTWPQFTYVHSIKMEEDRLKISREVKDAFELYECELPAVACVLKGINSPRKKESTEKKPEIIKAKDLGLDPGRLGIKGSPTKVSDISFSEKNCSSFVSVDGALPVRERIRTLMNGGLPSKQVSYIRGTALELAEIIFDEPILQGEIQK